ncbi:TetR family transcriptional regulator [Demequina capsici]|uniref:TetR family transcriptional regulator n=1 Tax=Demequina capsici TaxID=3075620 RepID=A0AA96F7N7_9MICO|nr:TetR family transcriptional regulator [Demequina sp. OYTSA14]WNM24302.1 TetR family transcriptional regulator [Demequina sp. OYTSA14]
MTPAPRGPRGAGSDTRAEILAAAANVFIRDGYSASMRAVARAAHVDPALVRHWFGSKVELFVSSLRPAERDDPRLAALMATPVEGLGAAITDQFLRLWDDPVDGVRLRTVLRTAIAFDEVATAMRGVMFDDVLMQVLLAHDYEDEDARLRASLIASQMLGLAVARHVLGFATLEESSRERLVALYGPTLQRYLTEDLGPLA